ncbi:MAG: chemotaxis protein [Massilia sp.]|nr:chemotaxis protein [Massilia sp.]
MDKEDSREALRCSRAAAVEPPLVAGGEPVHEGVLETSLFLTALHARFGTDFRGFNPLVIKAKLEELVARRQLSHISALQGQVLRDQKLGQEVIRLLSTGHSASPADSHLLMALRFAVVPILRSSPYPAIWIADCTHPGLVVLIAAMLKEEEQLERTQLYVTSADELLVQEIPALRMSSEEADRLDALHTANGGHASLRTWLQADADGFTLSEPMRSALSCHVHDLASDASFREFEAVVCARPLREYGHQLQQRALGIFSDSLCGFGILQIDPSSAMRTMAAEFCFAPVLPGQGLYRRLPR